MSIELKEAAQQALKELGEARKIVRASSSRQLAKDWDRRATDALANLRAAIQQAEAQQPATPEPVVDVRCEGCGYMTHHREHMGCVRAAKQHTHPAPSVPGEKPLPDLMMASYHEAIGWKACRAAMLAAKEPS